MKTFNTSTRVALVAAMGLMAGAAQGALVFELGTIISSSGTPAGSTPWLRATISQVNPTTVAIKMDAVNLSLSPTVEFVSAWAFNLNPTIPVESLSSAEAARTGSFMPSPIVISSQVGGFGGFSFDFDFDFATGVGPNGEVANRFTQGDSVTMHVIRAAGLSVDDFNYSASHDGRSFFSGAHLQSLEGGKSAFVGAIVPEPSTYIAGGLALLPLLFGLRARFAKKA